MKTPIFKPHFKVHTITGEGIYLISEQEKRILTGRLVAMCAPLINGRNSVDAIVDSLADQVSAAEVFYTLSRLEKKGAITDVGTLPKNRLTPFWTAAGIDPEKASACLETAAVTLTVLGDMDTGGLTRLLEANHIRMDDQAPFGVVAADDFLNPGLEAYNRNALAMGMPWILIKPIGMIPAVGPVFIPGKTACWQCFAEQNRRNRQVEAYVAAKTGTDTFTPAPGLVTPAGAEAAFAVAVHEILLFLSGKQPQGPLVRTLDLQTWAVESHTVDRLPLCTACGCPDPAEALRTGPPELKSRRIAIRTDGGFRTCSPGETLDHLRDRISPVTGAISRISRSNSLGEDLHVFHAHAGSDDIPENGDELRLSLRIGGTGKGMTREQAEVSCICETLECRAVIFHGDEHRIIASFSELGDRAVAPNDIMGFSDRQFKHRDSLSGAENPKSQIPLPLTDHTIPLEWSPVWSLTRGCEKFVLTESLYVRYRHPDGGTDSRYAVPTFNGTASGNTLEEAVLHGVLELVERDCIAMWWYNRLSMPGVNLDSFNSPYVEQLNDFYRTLNRRIWVLDLTNDLEIPAFAALSGSKGQGPEAIIFGFGCHLDPVIALHRALTEMNQIVSRMVRPVSRDGEHTISRDGDNWLKSATRENKPWLAPAGGIPPRGRQAYDRCREDDLLRCIRICQKRVEERGLEVLVKDQTRPELKLKVATVMVPGLRHFWPRFGPGRLYEVPVQLGWLDKPLTETDLNPISFFL